MVIGNFYMFENISNRFSHAIQKLKGQGRLSEGNIKDALRDCRMALLEADVALPVIKSFIEQVRERALGEEVMRSLTPSQAFIKIVNDQLTEVMGAANEELNLSCQPPAVVMVSGLQGSGKTTSVAKLAKFLKDRQKKNIMVVSTDVHRPAAFEQLKVLAEEVGVIAFAPENKNDSLEIAQEAMKAAKMKFIDVLIIDTAGRTHVDEQMMSELSELHSQIQPIENLFVVDAMIGQDAANIAKTFNETLPLSGIILTKVDGDARGGAALSVRYITGKPIKFLGVGEKIDSLEPFHPDRLASRILGMGDIVSLVEDVKEKLDQSKAEKLAKKIEKGNSFTLVDFQDQMEQMKKMGGMDSLMDKLPGMGQVPDSIKAQVGSKETEKVIAIIRSMTKKEKNFPALIKGSRKKRIADGSGTKIQDINKLLKQFQQMQKMMKKMKGGNMEKMMKKMKGKLPNIPGGFPF